MPDIPAIKAVNAARWSRMHIHADQRATFDEIAARLAAPEAKSRYQAVEAKTGVPWAVIAVIHEREASQNWNTHLAQGDPLHEETRHVPKGEPAFATWEEGAVDALENYPPHLARWEDWSIGGALTGLEAYNGFGPDEFHHDASGYLWAGTDQYVKGKYIRDRKWDPDYVDTQLGCAGLLKAMMALDASIAFAGSETPGPVKPTPAPAPAPAKAVSGGWLDWIISIFKAIFGRQ